MRQLFAVLLLAGTSGPVLAQQAPDINRVVDEGMNRSQVMQTAQHLTDRIGARLTNSPQMRVAEIWTQERFRDWGLKNVRKEGFDFGRGWWIKSAYVRMTAPRPITLTTIPVAWTPATNGVVSAPVIVAPLKKDRDFDAWRGKLAGKIVLVSMPGTGDQPDQPVFRRLTGEEIGKLDVFRQPRIEPDTVDRYLRDSEFAKRLDAFLKAEGAIAWVRISRRDGKLVGGEGYSFRPEDSRALPGIEMAAEDYRRLARLAKSGTPPVLEVMSDVRFEDADRNAYNIIAEIPGTDPRAGYVMAGAHLDSWVAGDGAVDNAAGTSMVMEAARILSAIGARPRRTIRFALWSGEEQGIFGSLAYVEKHLATRALAPGKDGDASSAEQRARYRYRFPVNPLPGHGELKAYFNLDNGSGKIRGIHAEGNVAAVPLLREWLAPFAGMGASAVVASPTGATDHVYLQAVGVPGYQFIQDPLDYGARLHHTSIDTFDHLSAEDMRQGAVVLAGMLLQSANSEKTLPRMPVPTASVPTDPFRYDDPAEQ